MDVHSPDSRRAVHDANSTGLSGEGLAGVVPQEGAFDEGGDVFLLFGGELLDGFELESQRLALGAAFVVVEEERVSADVERQRQGAEDVEWAGWCRLRSGGFG